MINDGLIDSIRETFGKVTYSHKTHEKDAEIFARKADLWKLSEVILIAATTTGVISVVFDAGKCAQVVTALLSAVSLLVAIYQFRFLPDQQITAHRITARNLWLVREKLMILLCDIRDNALDDATARDRRDKLTEELSRIYENAPHNSPIAYREAQKALRSNNDMTFDDGEIDSFLPPAARSTSSHSCSNNE